MTTKSRNDKTFPFSRFPDFPKLLVEVSAKKVTNYNVIYIIIYLYIYKYIIIILLVGKNQFRENGKSGNLHFPLYKGVSAILRYSIGTKITDFEVLSEISHANKC
jgi:hypothetical protein